MREPVLAQRDRTPAVYRKNAMKKKTTMTVADIRCLAGGIYSLTLRYPEGEAPEEVRPGQFAGIYPPDASMLLPRPISICRWDPDRGELRFVFRVAGAGTAALSSLQAGEQVDMLGILGNGYDLAKLSGRRVLLLGGGIGIPPMAELAHALSGLPGTEVTAAMGYRDSELFLKEEFSVCADLLIATEDGSAGIRGNVLDAVRSKGVKADAVCACGPMPMLRAVREYAREQGMDAFISLEERMACGVGACLGCVTKTTKVDGHSHVRNARICTEGPVFDAEEVDLG